MIFSQTQKQGILMLIALILCFSALRSFFTEKPELPLRQVSPLLLEQQQKWKKNDFQYAKQTDGEKKSSSSWQPRKYKKYKQKASFSPKPQQQISIINLNQADSAALDAIPGIGPKLTQRILKYKSLIGQFVAVEQLRLVYGLSEENYLRMAPYLRAEHVEEILKKDLNGEKSYKIAWFVGKEKATALTAERKKMGWFTHWAQVEGIAELEERDMKWLQAYFFITKKEVTVQASASK